MRAMSEMFNKVFEDNDFVMTPELALSCKNQALGAFYVYRNLNYLADEEYEDLLNQLEVSYKHWLTFEV